MKDMLKPAAIYFTLVFGVGFVLGTVRVLCVVPLVGARVAELIESPLMLLATVLAARWVVRRFCSGCGPGGLLGVGLAAVGVMLAAELIVGVGIRGMSPAGVFLERDPVSGAVYYGLLVLFALMPWLLGSLSARGGGGHAESPAAAHRPRE
jgi:hypothetical protein